MKKLAQAKMKIFRGAFLAFLIMSMSFMPSVQAASFALTMSGNSPVFEATPPTVGAVSELKLEALEQYPDTESFGVGGCLEIDFQPIAAYDILQQYGDEYLVFPGAANDVVDCSGLNFLSSANPPVATPANIKCELVTNFRIRLTLGTAGATIDGVIPGMHNPFSTYHMKINNVNYKSAAGDGCSK
jgi:hypothetical protein